jgi:hypothetical protein
MVESLALLLHILEVLGSNLSPKTGYPKVFLSHSKQTPEEYPKLGHNYYFPYPFKFIVEKSSHRMLYSLSYGYIHSPMKHGDAEYTSIFVLTKGLT